MIWKDVIGYEGLYIVSENGTIKSLPRIVKYSDGRIFNYKGIVRKQAETKDGYLFTTLSNKSVFKSCLIHRIVGMAFVDGFKNGLVINHKDGDRKNNHYLNLQWLTQSENVLYSYNVLGYVISEETRKRMSESRIKHLKKSVQ